MTKPNTTYHPLGDYIRKIDKRNRDLALTKPMGINIDKQFMPSVANVIGTDMSNYKLVGKNQFACNLMHVGRDGKIPVAINTTEKEILVSPAYHVFEIVDKNALSPDFLMMWFHREEFDREASFYTDADVRSGMDFKALTEMHIPVPPIVEQRAVVADYEAVQRRIDVAKRTIATLQATAQTLYRKMFVDGIDKENLPEGWRWGTLGEEFDITIGRTPPRNERRWFSENDKDNLWVSIADMVCDGFILNTKEKLIDDAIATFHIPVVPSNSILMSFKMTVGRIAITTKQTLTNEAIAHFICKDESFVEYVYLLLKNKFVQLFHPYL